MPTLLTDDLVTETLAALPGWTGDASALVRDLHLPAKVDAELRRQVEVDAHAMGHLPTVEDLADGTRFRLSTDEVGGVSELDVMLASHISDLAHRLNDAEPGIDAVRGDDIDVVVNPDGPAPSQEILSQRVL